MNLNVPFVDTSNEAIMRRSVVFQGIRELNSGNATEDQKEDYDTVIDIIRWLGITDFIPRWCIQRTRTGITNRRNIILTLSSINTRKLLLQRAQRWWFTEPKLVDIRIVPGYTRVQRLDRIEQIYDLIN